MKNSPLPVILLVLLAVSTLFSLWMCWGTINRTRELRYGREEAGAIETKRRIGIALAGDAREYSKTHPDILPNRRRDGRTGSRHQQACHQIICHGRNSNQSPGTN